MSVVLQAALGLLVGVLVLVFMLAFALASLYIIGVILEHGDRNEKEGVERLFERSTRNEKL